MLRKFWNKLWKKFTGLFKKKKEPEYIYRWINKNKIMDGEFRVTDGHHVTRGDFILGRIKNPKYKDQ